MSTDIISHTQNVIRIIANKYDLDYQDLYNLISLEFKYDNMILPDTTKENTLTCFAFVKNRNGLCRCARGKTFGNFCKTHSIAFKENNLPFGFFTPKKNTIETEPIIINNITYLYEKLRRKIYSMPEPNKPSMFLGYLNQQKNHIIK
jgi:hypothetical protein